MGVGPHGLAGVGPREQPIMQTQPMKKLAFLIGCTLSSRSLTLIARSDPPTADWPMWGGTADRNMLSSMKGLPTTWDVKTKKNIKWVAELGSQAYGNPVVANGLVFVGTNNESNKDPEVKGDKGILMAFRESDGQFMWQAVHDKLAAGRANDWPFQGICSSPLVENGIVYYVSNRGELMAVDADGFRDKTNDGLVKDEKLTKRDRRRRHLALRHDGRARRDAAQHGELVAGDVREPDLRQHVERPGREPRQRAVAEGAGDHRRRQDHRQAGRGRTTRSARRSCTDSGRRRRSAGLAIPCRS